MTTHNAENERIKRRYRIWLQDAKGRSETSIDKALAAINDFEAFTGFKSFRLFHVESARSYVRDLKKRKNPKTGKPYAKSSLNGILAAQRKFIEWLGGQPECRSRIAYGDADYLRLSESDERIARATRPKPVPSLDDVRRVIFAMPHETEIEQRNRALIAFALMTGARVGALASARIGHISLTDGSFLQDARVVKTKNRKTFTTVFFPVGDDIHAIFRDWVRFLKDEKGFGPDDPLFPRTEMGQTADRHFAADGIGRAPWKTTQPIRDIFKAAFEAVGLPPAHPHLMRDTLTRLGEQTCRKPEEFKAWSQNLGHEQVMTNLTSYGAVDPLRQANLIRELGKSRPDKGGEVTDEMITAVLDHLNQSYQPVNDTG